jgi:hypothetical protein
MKGVISSDFESPPSFPARSLSLPRLAFFTEALVSVSTFEYLFSLVNHTDTFVKVCIHLGKNMRRFTVIVSIDKLFEKGLNFRLVHQAIKPSLFASNFLQQSKNVLMNLVAVVFLSNTRLLSMVR